MYLDMSERETQGLGICLAGRLTDDRSELMADFPPYVFSAEVGWLAGHQALSAATLSAPISTSF